MQYNVLEAKNQLSTGKSGSLALQRVIQKQRSKGPIYVSVPAAYVFGLGADTYCSPTVRATNSSHMPIEELIVGIEFRSKAGDAGGSITRYSGLKVGDQDAHYFYQLTVHDCKGIEGGLHVVRCKYSSGEDCTADVHAIGYGPIPLRTITR